VVNTVDKLDVGPAATTNPSNTMQAGPCMTTADFISPIDLSKAGLSMVEATADTPKAPAGPTAPPIVAPIVVAVILAKWAYDVYQASYVPLLFPTDKTLRLCQQCSSPAFHVVHCRPDYHLTNP
jgi:hypothetical protein